MKIDKQTKLPELPEGCYWKVEEYTFGYFDEKGLELKLVTSDGREFVRKIMTILDNRLVASLRPRHVRRAARSIVWRYANQLRGESLIGTYPPKKLGE